MKEFLSDYLEEGTPQAATKIVSISDMIIRSFELSLSSVRSIENKIDEPTLLKLHTELVEQMSIYLSHLNSWIAFSKAIVEAQDVDEKDPHYTAFAGSLANTLFSKPIGKSNPNFWNEL